MRVVDLDRDMSDVIPTGTSPESEFLFDRMTRVTLGLTRPAPGRLVLDVASGVGQDSIALSAQGATVVGAEPSGRMTGMARLFADGKEGPMPFWVRGWSDALPFATGTFDATFCKGALDHFDCPDQAIGEMARVTAVGGSVVLAIANFDSLACRVGRVLDHLHEEVPGWRSATGRRGYDAPSDHFTRYDLGLMREQAERHLDLDELVGVSLAWGVPAWSKLSTQLPPAICQPVLQSLDALARWFPSVSDVVVLAGRPRRSSRTSA